jgi:hypothetical protein
MARHVERSLGYTSWLTQQKLSKMSFTATLGPWATRTLSKNRLLGSAVGVAGARWILSSTLGSEPLGKFSTLLDSSTGLHAHRCLPSWCSSDAIWNWVAQRKEELW